jgi:hypothetical protein
VNATYIAVMKSLFTRFLVGAGLLLFSSNVSAQGQYIISGSGTYSELSGGSISWTLGEVVIVTTSHTDHDLTQGFHQPDLYYVSITEVPQASPVISVYPNPADDILNVTSSDEQTRMSIYDMQGKLIDVTDVSSLTSQVDVSYLSRGTYMLMFEVNGAYAKQIKIVIQ